MDIKKIVTELETKYPGKKIIVENDSVSAEIIVEIKPGLALAVVGKSKPHYHKVSTEIYEVVKGELILHVDGKKYILKQEEKMAIMPNQVHSAQGDETWFFTYSEPAWTSEDVYAQER